MTEWTNDRLTDKLSSRCLSVCHYFEISLLFLSDKTYIQRLSPLEASSTPVSQSLSQIVWLVSQLSSQAYQHIVTLQLWRLFGDDVSVAALERMYLHTKEFLGSLDFSLGPLGTSRKAVDLNLSISEEKIQILVLFTFPIKSIC